MEQKITNHTAQRIVYLDALRVAAMFAVMVLHLAAAGHKQAPAGSSPWAICRTYDLLARFAVPVFVMISDALFLDPARNITMGKLLKKHIPRMALIFLIWSLGYGALQAAREYPPFSAEYLRAVAEKTVTGHYHLWYLKAMIWLYLITPLLRHMAAKGKVLQLLVLLTFLLDALPRLLNLMPARQAAPWPVSGMYTGYAGFYCLGHLLHSAKISKRKTAAAAVCAAAVMAAVVTLDTLSAGKISLLDEKLPWNWLYSTAVFLVLKSMQPSNGSKKRIAVLADRSLGMYLVHPAVNLALKLIGLDALTFAPVLSVPLCAVLVCAISFAAASVMKRIPLIKQLV